MLKRILPLFLVAACGPSSHSSPEGGFLPASSNAGVYPKPMVSMAKDRTLNQSWGDGYGDYKLAEPGVYGITAAPASPVLTPAEWDEKQAVLISWTGNFPDVTAAIVEATRSITDLWVIHDGAVAKSDFQAWMSEYGVSTSGIKYLNEPNDSIWVRDFGPVSIQDAGNGRVGLLDPRYYHDRVLDDAIPTALGKEWDLSVFKMPVEFEGGNFMSDGKGTCYTTNVTFYYNGVSEARLQQYFRDYMGCYQTIVLNPLSGEGTGHIDMFAKLVGHDTILLGSYSSSQDPVNKSILDANEAILAGVTLTNGDGLEIVRMPMPSNWDGNFRTYINSQLINGVNLVPVYESDTTYENQAIAVWEEVLPSWDHVLIPSDELITWSGAIHCVLMEVQKGRWQDFVTNPTRICDSYDCTPSSTGGNAGCGSVPVTGQCGAAGPRWCHNGEVKTQSCGSSGCNWVASGGRFGCTNVDLSAPNALTTNPEPMQPQTDCAEVGAIGCCSGGELYYCSDRDTLEAADCGGACGWDASGNDGWGWYDCGGSGADPYGEYPLTCN